MNVRKNNGFTIIEVMLFLAITGILIAAILGSAADSLYYQRYRRGVETFKNVISSQYSKALSLQNLTTDQYGNHTNDPCSNIGSSHASISSSVHRGTSDCLYVGRIITVRGNSSGISHYSVYPIVAKVLDSGVEGIFENTTTHHSSVTDENSLVVATFKGNSNITVKDKEFDWGLSAVKPNTTSFSGMLNFDLIIFRSPLSGNVTTYVLQGNDILDPHYKDHLQVFLDQSHRDSDKLVCIADLTGPLDQAQRMGIIVHSGASSPGEVEMKSEGSGC